MTDDRAVYLDPLDDELDRELQLLVDSDPPDAPFQSLGEVTPGSRSK